MLTHPKTHNQYAAQIGCKLSLLFWTTMSKHITYVMQVNWWVSKNRKENPVEMNIVTVDGFAMLASAASGTKVARMRSTLSFPKASLCGSCGSCLEWSRLSQTSNISNRTGTQKWELAIPHSSNCPLCSEYDRSNPNVAESHTARATHSLTEDEKGTFVECIAHTSPCPTPEG